MEQLKTDYKNTAKTLIDFANNMAETDPRTKTLLHAAWQCEMVGAGAHTIEPETTPYDFLLDHFTSSRKLQKKGKDIFPFLANAVGLDLGRVIPLHRPVHSVQKASL